MKIFHYFPKSISLLFTLMLLVGAVAAGCSDKDRDLYSEMAQKVDVYVDVSGLELAYDELYAQFDESAAERGEDAGSELVRLNVDESGKALLAEQVPVGSLLRFKLFFMMEDGTEAGCYDKLANGVAVTRGDGGQCVILVDEVMPPEPVPDPTPEPSPTVSPEPSPSPSASPSASPTPEPSPSPSGSPDPTPSPSPSASPEPGDDTVDVYLKLEGIPDVETIRATAFDWRDDEQYEDEDEDVPIITLDEDGVSTEPVATKKKAGDKLAVAVYLGQSQIGVSYDGDSYVDDPVYSDDDEDIYFYYENFSAEEGGTGVIVPEGQDGKSVIVLKYGEDIAASCENLVIFDLSGLDYDDYSGYGINYFRIFVYKDTKADGFGFMTPMRKNGTGYAPVYMHDVGDPGISYHMKYSLMKVTVDKDGKPVRGDDGSITSEMITGGDDTLLLQEDETEKTVKLTDDDFWS